MFLKKLELVGFKSFAHKTSLEFPGGIVAVVGPNGSGKSNIIDAVRWILGEREAKNLRGGKSEDLIFAGTPERPRLGMAEVRLSFDNASGFSPLDAKEITISRQVTRDGISRYFLNKSEIRLKDMVDFFAKSRLGVKGLSIINQGESDIFTRSTPIERRAMIEEILGLREYQLKKQEAERKLKNTLVNTAQAQATLEELKPHLRMLKRQTSKWERRSEIAENLKQLENQLFSFKLSEIKIGLSAVQPVFTALEEKIKTAKKKLAERENNLKKIESGQPEQLKELQSIRTLRESLFEKRSELQRELGRIEAKLEASQTQATSAELTGLLREIRDALSQNYEQTDWDNIKKLFSELVTKIDGVLNERTRDKRQETKKLTDELQKIESELKNLAGQESAIASTLEKFNSVFKAAFQEIEQARVELNGYETEKNKYLFDKERFSLKLGDLETQMAQAGRRMNEFTAMPAIILENPFAVEKDIFKLRGELAAIGEVDETLLKEARETETRHDFLSKQLSDLEKSSEDLQTLIIDLENKIHVNFKTALVKINEEFNKCCRLMFGGGKASLSLEKPRLETIKRDQDEQEENSRFQIEDQLGIDVKVSIPSKKIKGLDMLSGGERTLVSIAALFALVSVSPPPFLVLDEIDATLDERNSKKFSQALKEFSKNTQFILVTHNRSTMESANVLYGITMQSDGCSKLLSVKLEGANETQTII